MTLLLTCLIQKYKFFFDLATNELDANRTQLVPLLEMDRYRMLLSQEY